MARVQIEDANNNTLKRVVTKSVKVTGTRQNDYKPEVNRDQLSKVYEASFENPKYVVQRIEFSPDAESNNNEDGVFTIEDFFDIVTANSTDLYLIVKYGASDKPGGERTLPAAQDGFSDKIPVVLDTGSVTFDTKDSEDAYSPSGQMTFRERQV